MTKRPDFDKPATRLLQGADRLSSPRAGQRGFDPFSGGGTFRIAASDGLDPLFRPRQVAPLKRVAPMLRLQLIPR